MRCPRCGNENSDQNRFCGMCGATLLAPPDAPAAQPQRLTTSVAAAAAEAPARPQTSEPTRPAAPVAESTPSISGPSFLGLNDPPPRKRASLSIDPQGAPSSRNLNYLLDDEEEHRSSGVGKIFLILIALALAVGLGYLRWKNHGFGWLTPTSKPSAAQTATASDESSSAPPPTTPATTPSITPVEQPAPATQPAATAAQPPAATATPPTATPTTNSAADTASTTPPSDTAATPPAATPAKAPDTSSAAPATTDKTADGESHDATPTKPPTADTPAAPPDTSEQPKPATPPAPKPHAAVKPVVPVDPVAEAQKYLYGRGVPQNCERGMRLLKPAANQSNPKAMVEMGALYSAGLCTPHDLPTAYRWFALALRKDPNNEDAAADLKKLWGEMTQAERQLAIKLTQ